MGGSKYGVTVLSWGPGDLSLRSSGKTLENVVRGKEDALTGETKH